MSTESTLESPRRLEKPSTSGHVLAPGTQQNRKTVKTMVFNNLKIGNLNNSFSF